MVHGWNHCGASCQFCYCCIWVISRTDSGWKSIQILCLTDVVILGHCSVDIFSWDMLSKLISVTVARSFCLDENIASLFFLSVSASIWCLTSIVWSDFFLKMSSLFGTSGDFLDFLDFQWSRLIPFALLSSLQKETV